jgi:hypothetical protein
MGQDANRIAFKKPQSSGDPKAQRISVINDPLTINILP